MNEIYSLEDVARLLKVSPKTVKRQIKAGKITAFRVGRSLRFTHEALQEYMHNQEISSEDSASHLSKGSDYDAAGAG